MKSFWYKLCFALSVSALTVSSDAQEGSTPSGEWRGQVQWYATVDAKPDTAGHSVGSLVLAIDPRGKVVISSSDMRCTGLGLFSTGPMPAIKTIDITLKGCMYEGYNRRFGGTLLLQDNSRTIKLQLQASNIRIGSKTAFCEVKGLLTK